VGFGPRRTGKTTTVTVIAATAQGVYVMNKSRRVTRRNALQLGAAAAALPLVHIHTAGVPRSAQNW
jgi:hypothetical protein